jgi:phosphatidylserine/phosphatidylglycerophosphate/cardiolipin synthase-like enzyme
MVARKIFKNATTSQKAVHEALALVFSQEVLLPSEHVFVVAPWVSNIPILDNRQGGFAALNPEWPRTDIHLAEVLTTVATRGARLHLHVGTDSHNRYFEAKLKEALEDAGLSAQCQWRAHPYLHTKGILTDHVLVSGSMNFTRNGVRLLDESVDISFASEVVGEARAHFESYEFA